jgi:hypothetical protein
MSKPTPIGTFSDMRGPSLDVCFKADVALMSRKRSDWPQTEVLAEPLGNPHWPHRTRNPTRTQKTRCADLSFVPGLACFRWHDDNTSVWMTGIGARSLPGAITWHSSIK